MEIDTNIHNTLSFHLRNLILYHYRNIFQSLIISTHYSIHFRCLSHAISSNGVCSSFKSNPLPHLPVVADRCSLQIIKYSNWGHYGQIRLLTPNHKMFHSFSALIQPTHFKSTPSAPIFGINLGNPTNDIWARWWDLIHYGKLHLISYIIEPNGNS